jgi:hypothetical protein
MVGVIGGVGKGEPLRLRGDPGFFRIPGGGTGMVGRGGAFRLPANDFSDMRGADTGESGVSGRMDGIQSRTA